MLAAGRVGDTSKCAADSHGCPSCAHAVHGPATAGSRDILVNGQPALRVGDPGQHSSCCGPNEWFASTGAPTVLFNNRAAHRKSDATTHCGGDGSLTEGSPNVYIGDPASRIQNTVFDRYFKLTFGSADLPVVGMRYRIIDAAGAALVFGVTDEDGLTRKATTTAPERLRLEIRETQRSPHVDHDHGQ